MAKPPPHKEKKPYKEKRFLMFRKQGIKLFKIKNDLKAFFILEQAYNVLHNIEDPELENYLLESAYKGIWSSYSLRQFELMEYLASVAIRLARKNNDLIKLAKAYNGRSLALYAIGKTSIEYNQKANLILEKIIQNNSRKYNKTEIKNTVKSKIKNDFGRIINLGKENKFNDASKLADSTIILSKKYNLYIETARSYKIKGNLLFFSKKYDLSFQYLFKAHSILSAHSTKEAQRNLAQTNLLICENYFKLKEFQTGSKYLYSANKFLLQNPKKVPYILYALWGEYYEQYKKNTKKAIENYQKAISILNFSRWAILTESNIDSFLKYKNKEKIYLKLIKNFIKDKSITKAFTLLEQFRAKIFVEKVLLGTEPETNISRTIIEERKEITIELKQLYKQLDNDKLNDQTQDKINMLNNKLYNCDEKIISASTSQAYNGKLINFADSLKPETIKQIINKIPHNKLVITYFYYDNYSYIFLASEGVRKLISKHMDNDIETLVEQYLSIIKKHDTPNSDIEQNYYKGQMLELFVKPIIKYLDKVDELILVPFKALHLFPLHYLFLEIKEDILISYLPNFRFIDYLNKSTFTSATPILLIGDPRDDLPAARKELESVSKMFKECRLLIGKDADKKKVLSYFERHPIVHYSGHIRFNDKRPLYSFLELGESEEDKELSYPYVEGIVGGDASTLCLQEIYGLSLGNVRFLSLGGCSSGLGRYYLGEELVGLLRGFFYAGVKSILSTFWDIEDESGKEFIELFFEETLANNGNKKIGFSRAYKKMRAKYKDTFFYGGFGLYEGL